MNGHVGDRLVIPGTNLGEHTREGVIIDVRHSDGSPPYVVRWLDDGHEGFIFPGPDAQIRPPSRETQPG